jgi:hypothetical protein
MKLDENGRALVRQKTTLPLLRVRIGIKKFDSTQSCCSKSGAFFTYTPNASLL